MEKVKGDEQAKLVDEIFTRGVGTFVDPDGTFRKKLLAKMSGEYTKDIVVKFGVDPTRPDIHLGHAVVLRKLRQLQDLGCKVIFLVGDFTALIGDPTGKSKIRPELSQKEVGSNVATYLEQVDKILRVERDREGNISDSRFFSWIRNSDWFYGVTNISTDGASVQGLTIKDEHTGQQIVVSPTSFIGKAALYENTRMQKTHLHLPQLLDVSLINLLSVLRTVSLSQLVERDMFQDRIKSKEPLFMHEMLYPVIQGIDSDVLAQIYGSCDLEVGGTDQTFNMLMGRKVMETTKKEPQSVLAFEILVGLDGKEKMSKSLDNYIGITDAPSDMFGKVMSIPDSVIPSYFELCTFTPLDEIEAVKKKLKSGKVNPRDIKMDLAEQIVAIYHGQAKSQEARDAFVMTFQKKKLPDEVPTVRANKGTLLVDALVGGKVVGSKGEFRRLLAEGAIRKDGEEKLADPLMKIEGGLTLKVGKHRFVKIVVA